VMVVSNSLIVGVVVVVGRWRQGPAGPVSSELVRRCVREPWMLPAALLESRSVLPAMFLSLFYHLCPLSKEN